MRLSLAPLLCFGAAGGQAVRSPVVICRVTSTFASAAFPGVYFNRDCPCSLHTDAAAFAGSAEPEWRGR